MDQDREFVLKHIHVVLCGDFRMILSSRCTNVSERTYDRTTWASVNGLDGVWRPLVWMEGE